MAKTQRLKKGVKTGLIIIGIYVVFILYLLFVSDRVEKLDNRSHEESSQYSLKIGE